MAASALAQSDIAWLRRVVRSWFARHGRDFPWRRTTDPYEVLIAELLLQRTRADLVPAVYKQFLARYPHPAALAVADVDEVVTILRPLGFLHRSARLPTLARMLLERFGGRVPETESELTSLPGVGRYVANAVLVVAFARPRPLLDPNVVRLLERAFGIVSSRTRPREDRGLWEMLGRVIPARDPAPVALGLIDLGALVCLPRRPRCGSCPLRRRCTAFQSGRVSPSREG